MKEVTITLTLPITDALRLLDLYGDPDKPIEDLAPETEIIEASPQVDENRLTGEPAITKADVRAKGIEFTKAERHDELAEAFKKFGATRLKNLKEEHYADFVAYLDSLG